MTIKHQKKGISTKNSTVDDADAIKPSQTTEMAQKEGGVGSAPDTSEATPASKIADFEWSYTEEPHATRRVEILQRHPEVSLPLILFLDWE